MLKSKLNGGNTATAINTWTVALVRYTAAIVKWAKDELLFMDTVRQAHEETADNARIPTPEIRCRLTLHHKEGREQACSASNRMCNRKYTECRSMLMRMKKSC